ncbi:MAG: DUF4272 domain-containing protein [Thermomicrobiales bacterium]
MSDAEFPDDEIDIELRSLEEISGRLIILASLLRRGHLDEADDGDDAARERFDLRHWLIDQNIQRYATDDEGRVLDAPLGALTPADVDDIAVTGESLVALGWAVGLVDVIPPYDRFASPADLLATIPAPWDAAARFASGLHPRDDDVIAAERERAELWLWRAEIEAEHLTAGGPERAEIEAVIRDTARDAVAAGLIQIHTSHDFALSGQPFRDHSAETREAIAIIAERRLHALNWLCGFGRDWAHVPLDV